MFDQKLTAFQNATAQVDADKALLDRATEDLKKTQVTSPITGVLSKRYVERGDWVSEGKRLFQISDYQRIYLEAFLTDLDVGKLSPKQIRSKGEDAEVTLDAYPERPSADVSHTLNPRPAIIACSKSGFMLRTTICGSCRVWWAAAWS